MRGLRASFVLAKASTPEVPMSRRCTTKSSPRVRSRISLALVVSLPPGTEASLAGLSTTTMKSSS